MASFLSVSSGIFRVLVDTDRHLTPQTGGGALKEEARVSFVVQSRWGEGGKRLCDQLDLFHYVLMLATAGQSIQPSHSCPVSVVETPRENVFTFGTTDELLRVRLSKSLLPVRISFSHELVTLILGARFETVLTV